MTCDLKCKFEQLAALKTVPFCYGCYHQAPTGRCKNCGSDGAHD